MKTKLISINYRRLLCIVTVACLASCGSKSEETTDKTIAEGKSLPTVLVGEAGNMDFNSNITISGIAMANQEVKVYAMSNGYVRSWKHDIGDVVKKGETLAELANPELIAQQTKAKAEFDGQQAIYQRLESVYKKSPELIPLEQVDEAKAKYESAQAQLNAVNSQIQYLTITSPFNGVITNRYIDTGSVVQDALSKSGVEPLFKVQDISTIRINVEIPEVNSPYISKGTNVEIVFPDLPNTAFSGKVSRAAYGLSDDTKTMLVQIDIDNKNARIHPGMYATVKFQVSSQPNTLSVPNQAITMYEQEAFVYKVIPLDSLNPRTSWTNGVKCRLQRTKVKVGIQEADRSEIEYSDLKAGDRLLISGQNQYSDGATVIAIEKISDSASSKNVSEK